MSFCISRCIRTDEFLVFRLSDASLSHRVFGVTVLAWPVGTDDWVVNFNVGGVAAAGELACISFGTGVDTVFEGCL